MAVNISNLTLSTPVAVSATNPIALELNGAEAIAQFPQYRHSAAGWLTATVRADQGPISDLLISHTWAADTRKGLRSVCWQALV